MIKRHHGPGRPFKTPEESAVSIRLARRHVEMLHAHIELQESMLRVLEPERPNLTGHRRGILEREFLGDLIESHLSVEAQYQTAIEIRAPSVGDSQTHRETAEWMDREQKRLLDEAPPSVKKAIEINEAWRELRLKYSGTGLGDSP